MMSEGFDRRKEGQCSAVRVLEKLAYFGDVSGRHGIETGRLNSEITAATNRLRGRRISVSALRAW